jgi:PPIC-type peptidyl-prolyl cis-trans isomerase-like protein
MDQARRIVTEIKRGEDFATLAEKDSIDSTSSDGGLMGKVAPSMLRPELRDALRGVAPGQITPVVQTPLGYAILKVEPNTLNNARRTGNRGGISATAATGSVKYLLDISGLNEADFALSKFSKPSDWNQNPQAICQAREQSYAAIKDSAEDFCRLRMNTSAIHSPPSIC